MWGDLFTKTWQCWNNQGDKLPNAYWLHDKAHDELLMDAMAGEVRARSVCINVYVELASDCIDIRSLISCACSEESRVATFIFAIH